MNHFEVIDWVRSVNALFGLVCFVLLIARLISTWAKLADGQRMLFSSLLCFMVSTAWRSLEQILSDARPSYAILVQTVGLMMFFAYLVEPRSRYRGRLGRNPLGGDDFRD